MLNILKKKANFFNENPLYLNNSDFKTKNDKTLSKNKHYPPNTQEWSDSVYTYNKSYVKYIPGLGNTINNLISSFFSMTFIYTNNLESARKRIEYKRKLINKIFVSKALVKHTNNKAIITLFTYNRERLFLIKKIHKIYEKIKLNNKPSNNININKHILKNIYKVYCYKHTINAETDKLVSKVLKNNFYINKKTNNEIKLLFKISIKKNIVNINRFLMLFNYKYTQYNNLRLDLQKLYFYQNKILLLNNYRYKDFFLLQIKSLISKIYNKNVEFKIINLKKLILNSDIFIQAMVEKLRNRKNMLNNVLKRSLDLVKPVNYSKFKILTEKIKKNKNFYLISKYKNNFLSNTFSYSDTIYSEKSLNKNVIYNLKNKFIKGVKLRARGRLTTRLIASRSVNKFKCKGSLKCIDSSYKSLPVVLLKGYTRSNTQYTVINSVTRNGSFGLKGWVSSY